MIENRLKNNHMIPLENEVLGIYLDENSGKTYLGGTVVAFRVRAVVSERSHHEPPPQASS